MAYKTKFGGYQADSDLSASDWTKRWNTAATATVLGIGYEFISSAVSPVQSRENTFSAVIPASGTYIIALEGRSVDAPGVQGVSIDGQLGQELFEVTNGSTFLAFWLVDPTSFSAGDINVLLNSTHNGFTISVWQVFGNVTTYGDSAQGLTSGATDSLALSIRNVILGVARSGGSVVVGNSGTTKVMLHMDGADASTTFTDVNAGGSAKTWTAAGNAQIDTAQSKFGGASALFDGTGDYVSTSDHADLEVGTSDFTIDCWFFANHSGSGSLHGICGKATDFSAATHSYALMINASNNLELSISNGTTRSTMAGTTQFNDSTNVGWHHVAAVRSGSTTLLFVDGVLENSQTFSGAVPDLAEALVVGSNFESSDFFNGWIDEFRLSVGTAKWTSNFTPPTSEYVINSGAGAVSDIHFWANLTERLDQFLSGAAYWSAADQLITTDATSRELVVEATENPTTLTWAALAFYTPAPYFPSGQGVRFEKQSTGGRTFWSWDTIPQIADVDVLALVRPTAQSGAFNMGVSARSSGAIALETNYSLALLQSAPGAQDLFEMTRRVAGVPTSLGSVAFSWSLNTNYWLRFRLRGTTLQGRVWADGQTEPTAWHLETTDSANASGYVGIYYTELSSILEVGHFEARELFAEWPTDTIPNNWTVGIQGGPQLNKISFNPDVGPSIDRRRASAIARKYQVDCPGLTQTEYLAFVEFYHTTLKEGTLPFTAMDPFTGVEKTFKFGSEDPAYTESIQRSPGPDYTNGIYQVAFNVVRLD